MRHPALQIANPASRAFTTLATVIAWVLSTGCYQPQAPKLILNSDGPSQTSSDLESSYAEPEQAEASNAQPATTDTASQRKELEVEGESQSNSAPAEIAQQQAITPKEPTPFPVDQTAWIDSSELPWQAAFVHYVSGKRIGFSLITVEPTLLSGTNLLRITRKDVIDLVVGGKRSHREFEIEAIDQTNGKLNRFTATSSQDGTNTTTAGTMRGTRLSVTTTSDKDGTERKSVVVNDGTWGQLGVQALLKRLPMTSGEYRVADIFLPNLNQVVQAELLAGSPELTPVAEGNVPMLLPVDVLFRTKDSHQHSRNWIDESGEIMKTVTLTSPSVSQFRVPVLTVQKLLDANEVRKLFAEVTVDLQNLSLDVGTRANQLMLRVSAETADPFQFFAKSPRQSLRSLNPRECEITLRSDSPGVSESPPDAEDYAANELIQSTSESIEALASKWSKGLTNPSDIARKLTTELSSRASLSEFDSELQEATQTAQQFQGNVIDQAVLLTALLRNRNIPARVALGLQLTLDGSVRFHAWTEGYLEERWQSFDPIERSPKPFVWLKMRDLRMSDPNPYPPILEALQTANKIGSMVVVP